MMEPIEIVLVEDDPDQVELALRALVKHNLANHVHVVSDGVEALSYLQPDNSDAPAAGGRPRLVLLDLMLPRMNGLEVLRRLKACPATRSVPVVVLSSSREEGDLVASAEIMCAAAEQNT